MSRIKQHKAGEALRHGCRMALPNAANLNLDRIPIGTGVKSSAAVLFGPVLASGRGSRIIGHSMKETRFQAIGGLSQSSLPCLQDGREDRPDPPKKQLYLYLQAGCLRYPWRGRASQRKSPLSYSREGFVIENKLLSSLVLNVSRD